jgi:hypothetical protein
MRKLSSPLIIFIAIFFSRCTNHYEKNFYGTYIINDSVHIFFSKLTFYPENTYSFYSSSCLSSNHDTGSFVVYKDTICFTSFDLIKRDTNLARSLTGKKFIYQKDKIYYFNSKAFPDHRIHTDTTCWKFDHRSR